MACTLAHIFRHPVKGIGVEEIGAVTLEPGRTMPWDRVWAIAHEAAKLSDGWNNCANFIRGSKHPALVAIKARVDEAGHRLTLSHPERPEITIDPDSDPVGLIEWIAPLCKASRAAPQSLVKVPGRGMTDSDFASVSLLNLASLRALSDRMGLPLDMRRFRGNFWFEGDGPWQEFEWIGKRISMGETVLEVRERIERCTATTSNPDTGRVDADTLGALMAGWGHKDLGVRAYVVEGGAVEVGDVITPA